MSSGIGGLKYNKECDFFPRKSHIRVNKVNEVERKLLEILAPMCVTTWLNLLVNSVKSTRLTSEALAVYKSKHKE